MIITFNLEMIIGLISSLVILFAIFKTNSYFKNRKIPEIHQYLLELLEKDGWTLYANKTLYYRKGGLSLSLCDDDMYINDRCFKLIGWSRKLINNKIKNKIKEIKNKNKDEYVDSAKVSLKTLLGK